MVNVSAYAENFHWTGTSSKKVLYCRICWFPIFSSGTRNSLPWQKRFVRKFGPLTQLLTHTLAVCFGNTLTTAQQQNFLNFGFTLGLGLIFPRQFENFFLKSAPTAVEVCLPETPHERGYPVGFPPRARADQRSTDKCYRCWQTPSWKTNITRVPCQPQSEGQDGREDVR